MKLKKVVSYRIPFRSKEIAWCCIFLAVSVLLRCLHYFAPCDFSGWNVGNWIFGIILPILLCITFSVLLKLVQLRSPGIYGILAAALCLVLFLSDILECSLAQIILSGLTLPLLGFLLLATYGGYIPFRSITSFFLALVCAFRVFFWVVSAAAWDIVISDFSILAGLFCFTVSLKAFEN